MAWGWARGTLTGVVMVTVVAFVSAVAVLSVRVTTARLKANPWAVPWFAAAFALWVLRSTEDRTSSASADSPEPAAVELERAVGVFARPVAPPRRHLRAV